MRGSGVQSLDAQIGCRLGHRRSRPPPPSSLDNPVYESSQPAHLEHGAFFKDSAGAYDDFRALADSQEVYSREPGTAAVAKWLQDSACVCLSAGIPFMRHPASPRGSPELTSSGRRPRGARPSRNLKPKARGRAGSSLETEWKIREQEMNVRDGLRVVGTEYLSYPAVCAQQSVNCDVVPTVCEVPEPGDDAFVDSMGEDELVDDIMERMHNLFSALAAAAPPGAARAPLGSGVRFLGAMAALRLQGAPPALPSRQHRPHSINSLMPPLMLQRLLSKASPTDTPHANEPDAKQSAAATVKAVYGLTASFPAAAHEPPQSTKMRSFMPGAAQAGSGIPTAPDAVRIRRCVLPPSGNDADAAATGSQLLEKVRTALHPFNVTHSSPPLAVGPRPIVPCWSSSGSTAAPRLDGPGPTSVPSSQWRPSPVTLVSGVNVQRPVQRGHQAAPHPHVMPVDEPRPVESRYDTPVASPPHSPPSRGSHTPVVSAPSPPSARSSSPAACTQGSGAFATAEVFCAPDSEASSTPPSSTPPALEAQPKEWAFLGDPTKDGVLLSLQHESTSPSAGPSQVPRASRSPVLELSRPAQACAVTSMLDSSSEVTMASSSAAGDNRAAGHRGACVAPADGSMQGPGTDSTAQESLCAVAKRILEDLGAADDAERQVSQAMEASLNIVSASEAASVPITSAKADVATYPLAEISSTGSDVSESVRQEDSLPSADSPQTHPEHAGAVQDPGTTAGFSGRTATATEDQEESNECSSHALPFLSQRGERHIFVPLSARVRSDTPMATGGMNEPGECASLQRTAVLAARSGDQAASARASMALASMRPLSWPGQTLAVRPLPLPLAHWGRRHLAADRGPGLQTAESDASKLTSSGSLGGPVAAAARMAEEPPTAPPMAYSLESSNLAATPSSPCGSLASLHLAAARQLRETFTRDSTASITSSNPIRHPDILRASAMLSDTSSRISLECEARAAAAAAARAERAQDAEIPAVYRVTASSGSAYDSMRVSERSDQRVDTQFGSSVLPTALPMLSPPQSCRDGASDAEHTWSLAIRYGQESAQSSSALPTARSQRSQGASAALDESGADAGGHVHDHGRCLRVDDHVMSSTAPLSATLALMPNPPAAPQRVPTPDLCPSTQRDGAWDTVNRSAASFTSSVHSRDPTLLHHSTVGSAAIIFDDMDITNSTATPTAASTVLHNTRVAPRPHTTPASLAHSPSNMSSPANGRSAQRITPYNTQRHSDYLHRHRLHFGVDFLEARQTLMRSSGALRCRSRSLDDRRAATERPDVCEDGAPCAAGELARSVRSDASTPGTQYSGEWQPASTELSSLPSAMLPLQQEVLHAAIASGIGIPGGEKSNVRDLAEVLQSGGCLPFEITSPTSSCNSPAFNGYPQQRSAALSTQAHTDRISELVREAQEVAMRASSPHALMRSPQAPVAGSRRLPSSDWHSVLAGSNTSVEYDRMWRGHAVHIPVHGGLHPQLPLHGRSAYVPMGPAQHTAATAQRRQHSGEGQQRTRFSDDVVVMNRMNSSSGAHRNSPHYGSRGPRQGRVHWWDPSTWLCCFVPEQHVHARMYHRA